MESGARSLTLKGPARHSGSRCRLWGSGVAEVQPRYTGRTGTKRITGTSPEPKTEAWILEAGGRESARTRKTGRLKKLR